MNEIVEKAKRRLDALGRLDTLYAEEDKLRKIIMDMGIDSLVGKACMQRIAEIHNEITDLGIESRADNIIAYDGDGPFGGDSWTIYEDGGNIWIDVSTEGGYAGDCVNITEALNGAGYRIIKDDMDESIFV